MEKRDGSLRAVSTGMCRELCSSATPSCVPASLQTDRPRGILSLKFYKHYEIARTCLTLLNLHVATCFCECNLAVVNWSRRFCKRRRHLKPFCIPCCHPIQLISHASSLVISALGALQAVWVAGLLAASSRACQVQRSQRRHTEHTHFLPFYISPPPVCRGLWLLTIIFPLDKGFPLTEPLHADTVDDTWRLLCLESLVQLGEQRNAGKI